MLMKNKILEMEKTFFLYSYMSDKTWLNKVLHPAFKECGKSGYLSDKQETIEALLTYTKDRDIVIYNYEYTEMSTNTFLIHYITKSDNTLIYRTSIWINENHLMLLFHQASTLNTAIELIEA